MLECWIGGLEEETECFRLNLLTERTWMKRNTQVFYACRVKSELYLYLVYPRHKSSASPLSVVESNYLFFAR